MASKLYLVDGMSHIYRAFYAIQGLTAKDGRPTNAVYGFTNMLRKLISEEKPEYLGVAVDVPGPTVRHEKFADYKATRRPMPDDLKQQIPSILEVCKVLQVPVLSQQRYEADDVIGTLAQKATAAGLIVVIVTIDKDMYQLVNDQVTVLDTRNMDRLDVGRVEEKFGVPPRLMIDVLSLVGDSSDNIPGAPGIGAKGAVKLISEYGSLEQLLEHRDEIKRKTYRESLQNFEDQIRDSQELVTIQCSLPLDLNLNDLRMSEPDEESARQLFTDLEFVSLLEDLLPERRADEADYQQVSSWSELADLNLEGSLLAVQVAYHGQKLDGLGFSLRKGAGYWLADSLLSVPDKFLQWASQARVWVSHDLKSLVDFCQDRELTPPTLLQDPMLMAYLLNPNHKDFSLSKLAIEYLHYRYDPAPTGQQDLFAQQDGRVLAEASDLAIQLTHVLEPKLSDLGLIPLLEQIEIPLVHVLVEMERTGVRIDSAFLLRMSSEKASEIAQLEARILELAGIDFNLNSPKQLAQVLFEKLGLPQPRKTRKARALFHGCGSAGEIGSKARDCPAHPRVP